MNDNNNMTTLVAEAKNGSQAAYEALYKQTNQMVYFTCFGLLKSEADAADQMQEAYATAFQKLDMLDDPEKFPGWINRIAINKCKDFLIQQKRWLSLSEEKDISEELPETEEDFLPEEYLMRQDMREIVQKIMQKELSDVQYRTVLLYYYDGLSLSEIAKWMDCSEGTVKSRLHKAKKLIKTGVQKYSQKYDDKLYSIAVLPFLSRLLQLEAERLQAPTLDTNYLQDTNGQNPAYQQNPKQDVKLKQRKGRLQMGQNGLLGTTTGKVIAVAASLLVIGGGIAGVLAITNNSAQRNESQGNSNQENNYLGNSNQNSSDEALEMLNAEINAMIEAEQRAEEEREQQLEEGYPEGVFPPARYICRDLLDEESDIYIDKYVLSSFDVYGDGGYKYDADTKTYIFNKDDASKYSDGAGRFSHHIEGYLNDEGEFVVTYYARYDNDILYETVGTITGEIWFDRYEEEYPGVADIVLDNIEWVYVTYE
ncbi:MAG: RNA polymerase sigma factor [Lachnospiraceae bacterium]|nr:RNA polymerase sigma factor [Lachnospiraceae bacterium]